MQVKDNTKETVNAAKKKKGMSVVRRFTKPGAVVWDTVAWEKRSATITNENGEIIFQQKDC